ncbi:hypothetical protein EYF80_007608 [Liparis tanakae]|uniref:Uncharacterized protein n=1 Tax=Liparis tanakae TaxID=230148 RepID=A0A4Z2IWB0_9TELE|nr:hypothetical protein EYF80_007608 [Liparis tanakae]
MGRGKEAGGKERGERRGGEGSRVQETTGMCRMAGGWPGERTEKKWDCGRVNSDGTGRLKRKLTLACTTSVLLTELLVQIPELTNVEHPTAFEKLLSSHKYKMVLVQANENKEREAGKEESQCWVEGMEGKEGGRGGRGGYKNKARI